MKNNLILILVFSFVSALAQKDTLPYDKKKEIIFDGKRYRVHNNYLTFGLGKAYAKVRTTDQNVLNVDFQFHITKEHFQIGFFMSGDELLANNHASAHICYGKRYEKNRVNFAAFVGPSYASGYLKKTDTSGVVYPDQYTILGAYACIQAIYKLKYDVGVGLELFADVNKIQQLYGVRFIVFFSGGYRGYEKAFHLKTDKK